MTKKFLTLVVVGVILCGGVIAVNAASKVFYSYTDYSIASGATRSTFPPTMRVPYDYAVAQLKVNSTTSGTQETVFRTYYHDGYQWQIGHTKIATLKPGAIYYENLGLNGSKLWKIDNLAKKFESIPLAGWSGELYYISSTGEM